MICCGIINGEHFPTNKMNKFPNERNCAQNIKESYRVYIMLITFKVCKMKVKLASSFPKV